MNNSTANESGLWASNSSWNNTSTADINHLCVTLQRSFEKTATSPLASDILIVGLNSCFSIFATVLNLLVLIVLSRKEEFDTAANLVLKSMALSDFLVGLTVQPLTVVYHILDIYSLESCEVKLINSYLGMFCVGASMLCATMFSIDRCFATWFPLRYQEHVIYKKYASLIICGWIILLTSVLITCFNIVPKSFLSVLMTSCFYCCVLAICFCYVMIYKEVRKKRKVILPLAIRHNSLPANATDGKEFFNGVVTVADGLQYINLAIFGGDAKDIRPISPIQASTEIAASSSKQMSRSYTVVVILSVFLLCYLPVTVVKAVAQNQAISQRTQNVIFDWTHFLILLNSSINPVIYCIRVQKIKDEMKKLLNLQSDSNSV